MKDATSRAFADDIGTLLNAPHQIPTLHANFALFQRVSNLALKPKKCVVVPLGAPLTTERAQLVRDYITKHAPSWCSFKITDVAEYLGFLLGPKGGLTSWKKAVGNYYKTTKIIAAANLSPTLGFDLYNMRAAPRH